MNHSPTHPSDSFKHEYHDHHGHGEHGIHVSLKDYTIGFALSVLLSAIPFWLVMGEVFDKSTTTSLIILGFAAVQIVVQMVFFLHLNSKSEGGWTMLSLIFTAVLVVILLAGSIWVMYHLNTNMMPGMHHTGGM